MLEESLRITAKDRRRENNWRVIIIGCYLVSACLLGVNCRYDGGSNLQPDIIDLVKNHGHTLIPLCPEQLGGLPTPRAPAEIKGGDGQLVLAGKARVLNIDGEDVTACFLLGAEQAWQLARVFGAEGAILKEGSPSCGTGTIYDGSFQKKMIRGYGVTSALLINQGLAVIGGAHTGRSII